jgi:hypothetical protein
MLFGVAGCCVCLIIEAAIVATYAEAATNKAALAAGVAMYVRPITLTYQNGWYKDTNIHQVLPLPRRLQHGCRRSWRCLLLRALPQSHPRQGRLPLYRHRRTYRSCVPASYYNGFCEHKVALLPRLHHHLRRRSCALILCKSPRRLSSYVRIIGN